MAITIDVDVGGTFTDGFISHEGQIIMVKVDTTPHDLTECFMSCLEAGAERIGVPLTKMLSQTSGIRFSTTYSTNLKDLDDPERSFQSFEHSVRA